MRAAGRPSTEPIPAITSSGLTSAEARLQLVAFGLNTVSEKAPPGWRIFLEKFWAPVPWMLEASLAIEIGLGAHVEAAMIGALLLFNATLGCSLASLLL